MRVFLRHFYRDFLRAPIYPLLLLFTLVFAVAVTVTSSGLYHLIDDHAEAVARADGELGDLSVTLGADAEVRLLFAEDAVRVLGGDAEVLGEFTLSGAVTANGQRYLLSAAAVDLVAADRFYDFTYTAYGRFSEDTLDSSVILSESFAARAGLSVGDIFSFTLLNTPVTYTVEAIAKDTGLLAERDMLVSLHGVLRLLSERVPAIAALGDGFSPYTRLLVRTDAPEAALAALTAAPDFADAYVRLCGSETEGDFLLYVQSTSVLLVTVLILVLTAILSVTAMRLLLMRRRTELALFTAAGASYRQTVALLYAEGGIYAVIASALGILLAIPLTRGVGEIFPWQATPLTLRWDSALLGVLFAFVFAGVCIALTLSTERRLPLALRLEDTELAEMRTRRRTAYAAAVLSALTLLFFLLCRLLPPAHRILPAVAGTVCTAFALLFGVPHLLYGVGTLLSRLLSRKRMPASVRLAYENLRGLFALRHAGRLFAVTLAVSLALSIVQGTFADRVYVMDNFFTADYVLAQGSDRMKAELSETDGVICGEFGYYTGIELAESGYTMYAVSVGEGAEDCFSPSLLPKELPRGGEVALPRAIAELYGLSAGDPLTLKYKGNSYDAVVSAHPAPDSPILFLDAAALGLPQDYFGIRFADSAAEEEALAALSAEGAVLLPAADVVGSAGQMTGSFVRLLSFVLWAAVLLSAVGILNALLPLYRQRRRELLILRQCGLSRGGLCRLLSLELFLCFGLSLFLALCGGTVFFLFLDAGLSSFGVSI